MKKTLLAAALALVFASALLAAAPPASAPAPQADPAALAKVLALPAAPPATPAAAPPRDWVPAVCPAVDLGCCDIRWNGPCRYCADPEPGACFGQ